jgi:hypothetical protein
MLAAEIGLGGAIFNDNKKRGRLSVLLLFNALKPAGSGRTGNVNKLRRHRVGSVSAVIVVWKPKDPLFDKVDAKEQRVICILKVMIDIVRRLS